MYLCPELVDGTMKSKPALHFIDHTPNRIPSCGWIPKWLGSKLPTYFNIFTMFNIFDILNIGLSCQEGRWFSKSAKKKI
jgi:hypothetical protein